MTAGQAITPPGIAASDLTPTNTPNVVQSTTTAMALYVDPTGNDGNACTTTGTGACLTIQAALNKVPKAVRHMATITPAAGTYGCFFVSGFTCDPSFQTASSGIFIDGFGAFTNSTLATGSATGTATSSTAGSGTTFGTLTDTGATWTVNDLKGRFITSAAQTRVISSNTATAITITGTWTSPGAVAYTIQDPGVIINTACDAPATALQAASTSAAAILVNGNNCGSRAESITIRGIRTSNASGLGVAIADNGGVSLTLMQIRNTDGTRQQLSLGASAFSSRVTGLGRFNLSHLDLLHGAASTQTLNLLMGSAVVTSVLIRGGTDGLVVSSTYSLASITGLDIQGSVTPISIGAGQITSLSGAKLDCASSAGTGIQMGGVPTFTSYNATSSNIGVTSAVVSTCGIGISVNGSGNTADLQGLTGTAATTGMQVNGGAAVTFTSGSTITGTTQDISLDTGATTAALSDVAAGSFLARPSGSTVFQR